MKKLSILISAVLILGACSNKSEKTALEQLETDRFTVETEIVSLRDVKQELLLNGSVRAWEEAVIFPRIDGKLRENVLKEGDSVKRNQTIALIERDEVGAVYEPVVVPSTIEGVIGKTYLDPGANVTRSTPVALVVNQQEVRIVVDIPERYVGKIHIGQEATFSVEAFEDNKFAAKIYKISPVVDMQSRVVSVELKASNKEGLLKSGMFAKVKLVLEEKLSVPAVSITQVQTETGEDGSSKYYVFVVDRTNNTVSKREFVAGLKTDKEQEIISGVNVGEEIAKTVFGLKDGSKIKTADK